MKVVTRFVLPISIMIILALAACTPAATPEASSSVDPVNTTAPAVDPTEDTIAPETIVVTLKFTGWGGPDEQGVFQALVDSFNAQNSDIVIEYEPIPDDYVTKLTTMVAGGTPPRYCLYW